MSYSTSIAVTELTGVGARSVGVAIGAIFVALAFLPKALAVVLAIPGPVAAAYITVLLAMLFVTGMKMVVQDGIDYRKGLVVGVSFWAGVGFQSGVVFPEYFSQVAGGLLQNGMTAGGLVAILMTLFMELTAPRRRRIEVATNLSDLPKIREFLGAFASRNGWDAAMAERLDAAGEETLLSLVGQEEGGEPRANGGGCCWWPTSRMAGPSWSSSPPAGTRTCRTGSRCSTRVRPRFQMSARRRSGSCATSPRRFVTSSTTARKS